MIVYTPGANDVEDIVIYRCDSCGKQASYLSDSWSEITIVGLTDAGLVHNCLECRSVRQEFIPADHRFSPDELMAKVTGVCWHSPTSDRWACGGKP